MILKDSRCDHNGVVRQTWLLETFGDVEFVVSHYPACAGIFIPGDTFITAHTEYSRFHL